MNKFFLIIISLLVGLALGYFVFLGVFGDLIEKGKVFNPENFETMGVTIRDTISSVSEDAIIIEHEGIKFPIRITEETLILVPDEQAFSEGVERELAVKGGVLTDVFLGKEAEVIASFRDNNFWAIRIAVFPSPK